MNRVLIQNLGLVVSRRVHFFLVIILAALLSPSIPLTHVQAAAGDLDPSFGSGGKVLSNFGGLDEGRATAIQSDGKILVAGFIFSGGIATGTLLARYNQNGSPDPTFGLGGSVIVSSIFASALAIQADGKIVVAGTAGGGDDADFALARYNSNGSPDMTFGNGGNVLTDFFGGNDEGQAALIQADGKIVLTGFSSRRDPFQNLIFDFALARYKADGSLDSTFGNGGQVTTDLFGDLDQANAVAIQSDGKIVATGFTLTSDTFFDFASARYNADGSLDSTFGSGGKVRTDFHAVDGALAIGIQGDGKVVVAGVGDTATHNDFALVRYLVDGSLDSTFGMGGKVTTDFLGGSDDTASSLVIQQDGKIVAAGRTTVTPMNLDFALARYNTDGSLDSGFGSAGKVTTDFFGSFDDARAVALQADGKIVAVGYATLSRTKVNSALARYDAGILSPAFDICIQDDSSGSILQINTTTGDYQFTNCRGFTISGAGSLTRRGSTITLQHTAADRRVMAKIEGGLNKATASIQMLSQGLSFTLTDRNTANNTCACR